MSETNVNLGDIPTIGSSQIGENQDKKVLKNPDVAIFNNAPNDVSAGSFFGKIIIGAMVGVCVAALLFGTLSAVGGMTESSGDSVSSLLWILLPIISFVVGFVGNVVLAGLYNIFFSKRYYNFTKMFGLIFISSILLFLFFFMIYALFMFMDKGIIILYTVLGFHIIVGLYVSLNLMDFLSQPNYSAASLMGNTLGAVLAVLVFLTIIEFMGNGASNNTYIITPTIISAIVSYVVMILGAGIWDAIYYKFYEWGNNPFYLPSLNELREERQKEEAKKTKEEEDVNVDMK